MARCDTPAATACCFSSVRKRSKFAPPWHEAARGEDAVAGFAVTTALTGGGRSCCADAAEKKAKIDVSAAIAHRVLGIKLTGLRGGRRCESHRKPPAAADKGADARRRQSLDWGSGLGRRGVPDGLVRQPQSAAARRFARRACRT